MRESFIRARAHVKQGADVQRLGDQLGVHWTPTVLMLDENGRERHRIEGFLPLAEFLPQLEIGLGHIAFEEGEYEAAQSRSEHVAAAYPDSEAASEAVYWEGVSRYEATQDHAALSDVAKAFERKYQSSSWAKKASVWKG